MTRRSLDVFAVALPLLSLFFIGEAWANDPDGPQKVTYAYDDLGRLISSEHAPMDCGDVQTTDYVYDPAGNRKSVSLNTSNIACPAPQFDISVADPAAKAEGQSLVFTITRAGDIAQAASIDYSTTNGSAAAGSDYTAKSGTLSFAANQGSATVSIVTLTDSAAEGNETVLLNLSNATDGTIIDGQAIGTITNVPDFGISVADAAAKAEGQSLVFTVARAGDLSQASSVNYSTANGSAAAGSDYTAKSGTLSFAANQASKTVSVVTLNDSVAEGNETVLLTLSAATAGTITDGQASGVITNVPDFGISVADAAAKAEGQTLVFRVTRTGDIAQASSVNYSTANGSAAAGSDYTAKSGTISFAANQSAADIWVVTLGDSAAEGNETVLFNLSAASAGTITDGQASGTITNVPQFNIAVSNAATKAEGQSLVFTVTRAGDLSQASSINYSTANGSAAAGSDYTAKSGTLSFAANQASKTVSVVTLSDSTAEGNETVLLNISAASGGTITDSQGSGTITNVPQFNIAVSNAAAKAEGQSLVFTVTRAGDLSQASSVNYSTANGSAAAGSDYTAKSGTLSFAANQASKTVSVVTLSDSTAEGNETVLLNISAASGGTITDSQGSGTITNVVSNGPPVAQNDVVSVNIFDADMAILTANDSDPNGDALTIISVTQPYNASVTIVGNSVVIFGNEAGTGSFSYTISDGNGGTDTATVSLTVTGGGGGGMPF